MSHGGRPFISKKKAQYQRAKGRDNCGNCRHFNGQNETCDVVKGSIRPEFVSTLWSPVERGSKRRSNSPSDNVLQAVQVGAIGAVGVAAVSGISQGIT